MGLPLLLGLLHVALVSRHYHVGSFDDDASYILTAKALLAGQGLTGHLASGERFLGLYAPGYSALLVPLVWLWPHSFVPLRLLSVAAYAGIFPLTWVLLGRRRLGFGLRTAVLVLLALGPPLATYGSMVMAEAPFLDALLLLLLALDRWLASPRVISRWAVAVIGLSAGLIWLKEAGLGLVAGLFLWLLIGPYKGRVRRAAVLAGGVGALLLPVVVGRLLAGVPLAGSRYSLELGTFYQGGLLARLQHVVPVSLGHLLSTAIPATLVPYLAPLPINHHWPDLWKALSWHVTVLAAVGAVVWVKRYRDAAVAMVVVYLGESALWPFVNERRAILVLPLLTAWYALGAARIWVAVRRWLGRRARPAARRGVTATAVVVSAAVVAAPLVAQMPRDYLYGWNQSGSRFGGSRYVAVLRRLGPPGAVVETDYRSSTALFTGHRTNWTAFVDTVGLCYLPGILDALRQDDAAFLLLGDVNKPGVLDSPCLAGQARTALWAVPLLHSRRDHAAVYELIGPGTGHPGLRDPSSRQAPTVVVTPGGVTGVVTFGPAPVTQVSVGEAYIGTAPSAGSVSQVTLQIERPDGTWHTVAASSAAVGGRQVPYLVATLAHPEVAVAVRVVARAATPITVTTPATVRDLAVLGPA
ncbi:MAG TPA: hypothetical protein VFN68_06420 [Acidimicrobiales bacterium]|nr:hypothetical protein [Acidimicrobiales bacterium]